MKYIVDFSVNEILSSYTYRMIYLKGKNKIIRIKKNKIFIFLNHDYKRSFYKKKKCLPNNIYLSYNIKTLLKILLNDKNITLSDIQYAPNMRFYFYIIKNFKDDNLIFYNIDRNYNKYKLKCKLSDNESYFLNESSSTIYNELDNSYYKYTIIRGKNSLNTLKFYKNSYNVVGYPKDEDYKDYF